ncbi:MAG: hypothetical protein D6790_00865 [Caldilineae bacterium]|nr:MAG: hypothetical protein D6790_00865 [Caldilineae bacterium]
MADIYDNALAQYYGPREQGLATVLPAQRSAPFSMLTKVVAAGMAQRRKAVADAVKDLKMESAWRPFMRDYQRRYQEALNEISNLVAQGRDQEAALFAKQAAIDLKTYADASMQVGKVFDQLWKEARDSGIVRSDAYTEWLMSTLYDENGNIRDPRDIDVQNLTLDKLTQVPGMSVVFDGSKVLRNVVDERLKPVDFYSEVDVPDVIEWPFRRFLRKAISGKLRPYEEYDPVQRKVVIKDATRLAEEGIVDTLLQDPFARRVIEDYASERYGGEPRHMAVAKATYDLLNEYQLSDGSIKEKTLETVSRYPSSGGGGSKNKDEVPDPWLVTLANVLRGDYSPSREVAIPGKGVWHDVSHLFGATDDGTVSTLPMLPMRKRSGTSRTVEYVPATGVFANPDTKSIIVRYGKGSSAKYIEYTTDAKGRGDDVVPLFNLIKSAGKDALLKNAQKVGALTEEGSFNPYFQKQETGPRAGELIERQRRIMQVISDLNYVDVGGGTGVTSTMSTFRALDTDETRPFALRKLKETVTKYQPVIELEDGTRARVVDVTFQDPYMWEVWKSKGFKVKVVKEDGTEDEIVVKSGDELRALIKDRVVDVSF